LSFILATSFCNFDAVVAIESFLRSLAVGSLTSISYSSSSASGDDFEVLTRSVAAFFVSSNSLFKSCCALISSGPASVVSF
jgi:hypothetical protein